MFAQFIKFQMDRDERADKREQELTRLLAEKHSGAPDSTNTPRTLEPTAGKVVVATLQNPENAAYVGMSLGTMYTVDGDIRSLDMSKVKNKIKTGEFFG